MTFGRKSNHEGKNFHLFFLILRAYYSPRQSKETFSDRRESWGTADACGPRDGSFGNETDRQAGPDPRRHRRAELGLRGDLRHGPGGGPLRRLCQGAEPAGVYPGVPGCPVVRHPVLPGGPGGEDRRTSRLNETENARKDDSLRAFFDA